MEQEQKFQELTETYINGNISDFKRIVKKFHRSTLVSYIQYVYTEFGQETQSNILNLLSRS